MDPNGFLDSLTRNLRYGTRALRKAPGFITLTIVTLGLGLGVNIAIFSLIQAVLLRQLPYDRPSDLIWAWSVRPDNRGPFNIPDFIDYRDRNRTLESIGAFAEVNAILTGPGEPARLHGLRASGNLFRLLGVKAALGRTLEPGDDSPDTMPVVVLAHSAWTAQFGGDRSIVGRKIVLDGNPCIVVGVLPRDFVFPKATADYAVPLAADFDPARARRNSINLLRIVGRMKPGVTIRQAEQDLASTARQLQREYPVANSLKQAVALVPLEQEILGAARETLLIVVAAVSLLLLSVLANASNSLMARSTLRQKEVAIRTALGANRWQVLSQAVTENMLLTGTGAVLGILISRVGLGLLMPFLPATLPRADLAAVNGMSVVYAVALAVLLGSLLSFVSIRSSRGGPGDALKSVSRGASGGPRTRSVRMALIVVEVALSFALLIGAGLLTRSFARLIGVAPGFVSDHVMVVGVSLPLSRYNSLPSVKGFLDRAQSGLSRERGLESYSVVSIPPVSGITAMAPFSRKDRPSLPQERQFANYRFAGIGYFHTMRIPVIAGREFALQDDENSLPVAIVSEQFARRYLPDTQPLGIHLLVSDNDSGPREVEIVGVVGNVKQFGLDDAPSADLYVPAFQVPNEQNGFLTRGFTMVIRQSGEQGRLTEAIKGHLTAAEPEAALVFQTMDEVMGTSLGIRQFQTLLMGLFSAFATLLAGLGLYSVMSYLTTQRTREIGVRLALGATAAGMTRLVVREGLTYATAGIVLGAAVVAAGFGLIANRLYLTGPFDWAVISSATGLVLFVASLASWLPARRASRIDPVVVLRNE